MSLVSPRPSVYIMDVYENSVWFGDTRHKDGRKGQNERMEEGKMSKEGRGGGKKRERKWMRDYYILVLIAFPVFI